MELLFRSVARAGGIEVPTEARFFEPPKKTPWERRLAKTLARALTALARRLAGGATRAAGGLADPTASGPGRTPAHP